MEISLTELYNLAAIIKDRIFTISGKTIEIESIAKAIQKREDLNQFLDDSIDLEEYNLNNFLKTLKKSRQKTISEWQIQFSVSRLNNQSVYLIKSFLATHTKEENESMSMFVNPSIKNIYEQELSNLYQIAEKNIKQKEYRR